MRWSIISTIWFREMRGQLRDRRTLIVILGLPLILYPLLGFAVVKVAAEFTQTPSVIGVVTGSPAFKDFPARQPDNAGRSPIPRLTWLAATPLIGSDMAQWAGAAAFAQASQQQFDYPGLIAGGYFTTFDSKFPPKESRDSAADALIQLVYLDKLDPAWQDDGKLDLILEAPDDFFTRLEQSETLGEARPSLHVRTRPGNERSRLAMRRLTPLLDVWNQDLKHVRLARKGLTEQYLDPIDMRQPEESTSSATRASVANLIMRLFPLLLVVWSLSGALYPAIDLCAGEKERGTMETLLITPALREEIVMGKFLTIWIFSAGTALTNLLSMGITTSLFGSVMPQLGVSIQALLWCVVLSLPQAAFFSALSLAIGAYARSSKEGQYYLMPLFVVTMPLICLTLVPGVDLNPLYALVPVTGVALLMQRLMTGDIPWAYFIPVLAPIALYSWLALRWAIEQFNREDVLFREAEHFDIGLWFQSLCRDKEPTPTTGQAFFCLGLLIGLRWLTLGMGDRWLLEIHTAISELAFVAMPAIFMVMVLNTEPNEALYLRWPHWRETGLAAVLAMLLLPPMTGLAQGVALWFPHLLEGKHPLIEILRAIHEAPLPGHEFTGSRIVLHLLAFALVPALCEEIAFRGFILQGLHHGFRPRNAVLLSSFFFALFHMNVFLFVPTFLLGVVLGLLTVRSRSLLPAILFHLLYNAVLIALIPLTRYSEGALPRLVYDAWPWLIGVSSLAAGTLVWWLYNKPYADLELRESADAMSEPQMNTDEHR